MCFQINKELNVPYDDILRYFEYKHLPGNLQEVSKAFHDLAHAIADHSPMNPERSVCLRKLLEAKDAAVRSNLPQYNTDTEDSAEGT